jgi:hypothetical protein
VGTDPITDQISDPPPADAGAADGVPSDNTTLSEVLARFESAGFTGQFGATDTAQVRCFTCRRDAAPADVEVVEMRRLEGASDPDDMLAIVAIRCPHCGADGTAVLGYGPDSASEEAELLLRLERPRHGFGDPGQNHLGGTK